MNKTIRLFSMLFLASLPSLASAIVINDDTHINGFISQGLMMTPDNAYAGIEDSSTDVRALGLNGFYTVNDQLHISGLVLANRIGEVSNGEPKIHYLLADYHSYDEDGRTFGVRLGRVQNQFGIYNSTRFIPNTRPGILVPQSVYFDSSLRELMMSTDGINLYARAQTSIGEFELNLYAGSRDNEKKAIEVFIFKKDIPGDFKESDITGFKLDFTPNSKHDLNLAYSVLRFGSKLDGASVYNDEQIVAAQTQIDANPFLTTTYTTSFDLDVLMQMFSLQHSTGNWVFTGEYSLIQGDYSNVSILHDEKPDTQVTSDGYYLQAEYLGWQNLSVYARLDWLNLDNEKKYFNHSITTQAVESENQNTPAEYLTYGRGQTLGLRWFVMPELSLSAQFTRNEGTAWLPLTPGVKPHEYDKDWNWYSFRLTYEF